MAKVFHTFHHDGFTFVFGSNLAGRHGRGAAETARRFYGAAGGRGQGPTGNAYALPTKDAELNTLSLRLIEREAHQFLEYARSRPWQHFMLTRLGCGLAGYGDDDIAPLFARAPGNVWLPRRWQTLLGLDDGLFRLVVAGSRTMSDDRLVFRRLDHWLAQRDPESVEIVSGACEEGVDPIGEFYAEVRGLRLTRWPAAWDAFGNPAGPLRNAAMAWYSDALGLFRRGQSRGSTNMLKMAEREMLLIRQG